MSASNKKINLSILAEASQHYSWKAQLQTHMFRIFHNVNMEKLRPADTLDPDYFKTSIDFKDEFKEASKDASNNKADPFNNPDALDFPKKCFKHALATGEGFHTWLYVLFDDVRSHLSEKIQDKTAGVALGDLVGLLQSIKLSIHHFEQLDPDDLFLEFGSCTMAGAGDNDLMMFLAKLAHYKKRLEAAGQAVSDSRAQRVLLKGLDQDIFETFISTAERHPYDDYDTLQKALESAAAKPRMLDKLRTLKPGNAQAQSVFATRTPEPVSTAVTDSQRIAQLEAKLASLSLQLGSKSPSGRSRHKPLCRNFAAGRCTRGDKCDFYHPPGEIKFCKTHGRGTHSTEECRGSKPWQPPATVAVTTATEGNGHLFNGFEFTNTTRFSCGEHVFTLQSAPKIDRWCVDGASTTHATYDRDRCFNIRPCSVSIHGPNSSDSMTCTEMGDTYAFAYQAATGMTNRVLLKQVLINTAFPFHIVSEILLFEGFCTATKSLGSWQFYTPEPARLPLLHASQHLTTASQSLQANIKLYFMDEQPKDTAANTEVAINTVTTAPAKISPAKNLQMLVELHCALSHRNFADVAEQFGLSLPSPAPECYACLLSKPRKISHDKVSTRRLTRVGEGFSADAKGPMNTPTPEGYQYFFVIADLYAHCYYSILAKSQAEWKTIWPTFVNTREAQVGHQRSISFILTDCHKVHMASDIKTFNDSRGIEGITTAPHSQWQDPSERGIQTIAAGARTNLIHGGGKDWMWGWAVLHSTESVNRTYPPKPIPGYEGKSRLRIANPTISAEKEMRTQKPFLSLAFKTKPKNQLGSNFDPRAYPVVVLLYIRKRKAYAVLTIPNLYLEYTIELRFVTMAFPLRATNYLSNQLDTFLRPTTEDELYKNIHGPGSVLRRSRLDGPVPDRAMFVEPAPTVVCAPAASASLPGPGWSSSRGYTPSEAGLRSAASVRVASTIPDLTDAAFAFTTDQLAARVPRNVKEALTGPDRAYWEPSIKRDFAIIRDNNCIINITPIRPPGSAPPAVEQRFKIKFRDEHAIALADIAPKDWKTRTIVRGDRFKEGEHYDETAAPVAHAPVVKMLVAWAVAKGLFLFAWDIESAFYLNTMDRPGVIVKLSPGYDPVSTDIRPLDSPPLYGELAKALPGIPQGSLLHYCELSPALQKLGLLPSIADNCLFIHSKLDIATTIHVDDGLLAAPSLAHAEAILGADGLGSFRKITWGPLRSILGCDFEVAYSTERRLVFMSQRAYATQILERADMMDCNPAPTPACPGYIYTKTDCPRTETERAELDAQGMTKKLYHTLTASTNFLVCTTREDMRFSQGKNSKFCANPGLPHWQYLKRMIRFIKGTLDYGIEFSFNAADPPPADGPLTIEAYSDSSFADDVDTARTTLGFVIKVNGATILASSKLSERVDSCVNHSELRAFDAVSSTKTSAAGDPTDGASVAFGKAARNLAWIRGVKADLEHRDVAQMPPTPIYVDNAGVLSMLEGKTLKSANKHIYRTLAENRERVHLDKSVKPVKIATAANLANAMTKQEHGVADSAAQLRMIAGPRSTARAPA